MKIWNIGKNYWNSGFRTTALDSLRIWAYIEIKIRWEKQNALCAAI